MSEEHPRQLRTDLLMEIERLKAERDELLTDDNADVIDALQGDLHRLTIQRDELLTACKVALTICRRHREQQDVDSQLYTAWDQKALYFESLITKMEGSL